MLYWIQCESNNWIVWPGLEMGTKHRSHKMTITTKRVDTITIVRRNERIMWGTDVM